MARHASPGIRITADSDVLVLLGDTADAGPTCLRGSVVFEHSEAASFSNITLVFVGNAKIPSATTDKYVFLSVSYEYGSHEC